MVSLTTDNRKPLALSALTSYQASAMAHMAQLRTQLGGYVTSSLDVFEAAGRVLVKQA